jgi:hypothetical protein
MNALKFGVGRFKGQERTRQMPGSDPFKWPANYDFYDPDVGHVCGHLVGRLWITSSTKAYEEVSYWSRTHYLDLHLQYLANVEKQKGQNRAMQEETFRKYMKAYHIDLAFTRAKEDYCDTCIRLSIAVADPDQEEIVLLIEAQSQHATDALTQRLALKSAIKEWAKTQLLPIFLN